MRVISTKYHVIVIIKELWLILTFDQMSNMRYNIPCQSNGTDKQSQLSGRSAVW